MKFDDTTRRLIPDEGLYLSQRILEDENSRIFSQLMFLGINDSPNNYSECTTAEKEQWERDHAPEEPEDAEVVE